VANPLGAICAGTSVTFTATPANGGTTPSYQWKKNGSNVGTNSTAYTNAGLVNGDKITCVLTSNITCPTGNPATSNEITMTVNANLSSVNITPTGAQSICDPGTGTTLTVAETGGGAITGRQWGKRSASGGPITSIGGATGSTYSPDGTALGLGTWYVVCTSTPTCGSAITSNEVTVTVNSIPIVIDVTPSDLTCFNNGTGFITINSISGGTGPYSYSTDNGSSYTGSISAAPYNITGLAAGTYRVRVKDSNGCSSPAIP
jgi:SprB repeat